MNYSSYRSSRRQNRISAFYIVLAICLLAVGAATWYSAHSVRQATENRAAESTPSDRELPPVSSDPPRTEIVESPVKDQPYTANQPSSVPSSSEPPAEEKKAEPEVFSLPLQGEIIKPYSDTELQYSPTFGDLRLHLGIDLSCQADTAVSAAASGTVTGVESSAEFGTILTIDHGSGLVTRYACIKEVKVKAGDKVAAGDILGIVDEIPGECADQSHLHFEFLKNGHPADPSRLFKNE